MNISANGFMQQVLTLCSESAINAGTPVKMTDNYTVAPAADGDDFCGVALSCRDGLCAVQLQGAVTLPYSGTAPTVGRTILTADGEGGVEAAESGNALLVLAVNTDASTVTCIL